ncbi:MAG: phospholipase A [bacterium]|nr:phospholipase A [bacterium]
MKKLLVLLFVFLFGVSIFAQEIVDKIDIEPASQESDEDYSAFSLYKSNYMVFGNYSDQVKGQISFKYELVQDWGIHIGYSQYMFWDLYKSSSPFREVNYNPELFWRWDAEFGALDYLQAGFYEHESNGKDGASSRSWDRSYLQFQLSVGERVNLGLDLKGFYSYRIASDNSDIVDYVGYYEAKIFLKLSGEGGDSMLDKEEIYLLWGTGKNNYGFDFAKGWYEAGVKVRLLFAAIQPYLYLQGFYGYGESLIDYNKKDWAIRFGFVFE